MESSARAAWKRTTVGEVIYGLYDGPHATPEPSDKGPVFLGIKNITEDGRLDLTEVRHISEEAFPKWTRRVTPQEGDIVFTYEATLNRYAIIPTGFRGCLGRRLALLRTDSSKVDTRFLFHYFFGSAWRNVIAQNILSGSTVDRIPLTNFPQFPLELPPLETQCQIAAILSAYDDLIENNARRIKVLEEMAGLIYREWFVNFRFPGHQGVRRVASELGEIPEGWEVKPIGACIEILGGGTPSKQKPEFWEIDDAVVNWFTPSDLTAAKSMFVSKSGAQITQLGLAKSSAKLFPAYSVMMTSRATIGVIAINTKPASTNQGFIVCMPTERLGPYFLYFWLEENMQTIDSISSGATFKEVRRTLFRELPVVVPTEKAALLFKTKVGPIGKLIENLHNKNQNLRRTRDLLLSKLISGELDVPQLRADPEDVRDLADLRAAKAVEGESPALSLDELKLALERG